MNQYAAVNGQAYAYDGNGNLTSDYLYDIENRLVASGSATLRYDPLGRLYEVSGGSGTTRFLHDGDATVAEYDAAGAMLRRYVHGAAEGVDDPMVWFEGAGMADSARRYLFADERGSIVAVTDANGNAQAINRYDEYGLPDDPGIVARGRFRYTGQAWLPEVGLYYYKARMYSARLGRFMQTDPIGYKDQFNLYGYVGNDPVNGVDPSGTTCVKVGSVITCTVKIKGSGEDGKVTKQDRAEAQKLLGNYLKAAVKADAAARDGLVVTVKPMAGSGQRPWTIPAKEIRNNLFSRVYTYYPKAKGGDAGMSTGSRGALTKDVTIYGGAANYSDRWQQGAFLHEGIHGSYSEGKGMGSYATMLGYQPWSSRHQGPYEDATDQILNHR